MSLGEAGICGRPGAFPSWKRRRLETCLASVHYGAWRACLARNAPLVAGRARRSPNRIWHESLVKKVLAKVGEIARTVAGGALWLFIGFVFVNEIWNMRTGERLYTPGFLAGAELREYGHPDPLQRRYRLRCRAGDGADAREYFVATWLYCRIRGAGGCRQTNYTRAFAFWGPNFDERYFVYQAEVDREALDAHRVFRTAPVGESQDIRAAGGKPAYRGDEAVFEIAVDSLDFAVYPDPDILERSSEDFFFGRRTDSSALAPLQGRCTGLPPPDAPG